MSLKTQSISSSFPLVYSLRLSLPVKLGCSRFLNKSEEEPDIHEDWGKKERKQPTNNNIPEDHAAISEAVDKEIDAAIECDEKMTKQNYLRADRNLLQNYN